MQISFYMGKLFSRSIYPLNDFTNLQKPTWPIPRPMSPITPRLLLITRMTRSQLQTPPFRTIRIRITFRPPPPLTHHHLLLQNLILASTPITALIETAHIRRHIAIRIIIRRAGRRVPQMCIASIRTRTRLRRRTRRRTRR